jgi:hypothetical protein
VRVFFGFLKVVPPVSDVTVFERLDSGFSLTKGASMSSRKNERQNADFPVFKDWQRILKRPGKPPNPTMWNVAFMKIRRRHEHTTGRVVES